MSTTDNEKDFEDKLPAYISFIYGDLYRNQKKCAARDSKFSCDWRTFFQYGKLVSSLCSEIKRNDSILQMGLVFGNQIDETAMATGSLARYDIIDINEEEVKRFNNKYLKVYPGMRILHQDAANMKTEEKYDIVICFMLLSMVPSATKAKIVNKALQCVKSKGKVIFIDWHNPWKMHPLRYLVRMYNRLYHPFVERLWDRQINVYADPKVRANFNWRKTTYFGGMFQKVVVTRKKQLQESWDDEYDSYAFNQLQY
ncbi:MAG: class I SAM-dependent methyltransferase [Alphaproteobacteria bacterium]|nr:class I SAM-dependent methyltransferase [Alphaproteobacteria bacterium]